MRYFMVAIQFAPYTTGTYEHNKPLQAYSWYIAIINKEPLRTPATHMSASTPSITIMKYYLKCIRNICACIILAHTHMAIYNNINAYLYI